MKGRENFHLREWGCTSGPSLVSCADCTRERYRPTSDAASARHSYDRISNTAESARKRPLRYVQLAAPISLTYDRIIRGIYGARGARGRRCAHFRRRRFATATGCPGPERRREIDLRACKSTTPSAWHAPRKSLVCHERWETISDRYGLALCANEYQRNVSGTLHI